MKTMEKLEFAVFCIESVAEELNKNGTEVYDLLSNKSEILETYIIEHYDVLHTQSKAYIVEDIITYMKEEGVL